jgi:hypothetical protein
MNVDTEVAKIILELEDGNVERFEDPDFLNHVLHVAQEAIESNHPDGEELLAAYYAATGDTDKAKKKSWESAVLRGRASAVITYAYKTRMKDPKTIALLQACLEDCGNIASAHDHYDQYLEGANKEELKLVEKHYKLIRIQMNKNGIKFSF